MAFAIALIVVVLVDVMVVQPTVDVLRRFFFPRHYNVRGRLSFAQSLTSSREDLVDPMSNAEQYLLAPMASGARSNVKILSA